MYTLHIDSRGFLWYNYKYIRTPIFESSELFHRGVGESTDIVTKETYDFKDRGDRDITLRPEGTAGTIRAYLENGIFNTPSPTKLWYNMSMFRYENVQKGRLREFHQIGAELIGSGSYLADVDVILMANNIFKSLNILIRFLIFSQSEKAYSPISCTGTLSIASGIWTHFWSPW